MHLRTLNWKIENCIGHLVLNQPPANTMTRLFFEELSELTGSLIPNSSFKALLIYGKGRHFSSGADHFDLRTRINKSFQDEPLNEMPAFMEQNMESFIFLHNLQIPTFAAIRGTCLGSALELALTCKYRICAEGTVLGFPETSFGLMPGCGGTIRLQAISGLHNAMELILSGKNFSAEEALKYGIVHKVVHKKGLLEETIHMAETMINR
jgi:enoyl-CoA hydratase/carnithine racemase